MSNELVTVTGRFTPATLARLDRLAELLHTTSKTEIIAGALNFFEDALLLQASGGKVVFREASGEQTAMHLGVVPENP